MAAIYLAAVSPFEMFRPALFDLIILNFIGQRIDPRSAAKYTGSPREEKFALNNVTLFV